MPDVDIFRPMPDAQRWIWTGITECVDKLPVF